ncbi:hypothetical protein [Sulfuriflexus mobilis]|uniref:hypothetical protein n=1 Tax=Sulfuriflexus mobilis TaxID=1811807 RepID=UPI000F83F4FD|nr:hypothetical protein [Sulfuriflexus mobilis]
MNTQTEVNQENIKKTLGKLEWLLARSEQANRRYSRAQMEAFAILRDSFKERLDNSDVRGAGVHRERRDETCHA